MEATAGIELTLRANWRDLWIKINGQESWDSNPVVWVTEFRWVDDEAHEGDHGILFSAPMVRAIRENRKTMTRRLAKPRWKVGDHLWVRETWRATVQTSGTPRWTVTSDDPFWIVTMRAAVRYRADNAFRLVDDLPKKWLDKHKEKPNAWNPAIFLPRIASRFRLEVVGVRSERLHDITTDDIIAEGVGLGGAQ